MVLNKKLLIVITLFLLLGATFKGTAQSNYGAVRGVVADGQGAAIAKCAGRVNL